MFYLDRSKWLNNLEFGGVCWSCTNISGANCPVSDLLDENPKLVAPAKALFGSGVFGLAKPYIPRTQLAIVEHFISHCDLIEIPQENSPDAIVTRKHAKGYVRTLEPPLTQIEVGSSTYSYMSEDSLFAQWNLVETDGLEPSFTVAAIANPLS